MGELCLLGYFRVGIVLCMMNDVMAHKRKKAAKEVEPEGGNRPFAGLAGLVRDSGISLEREEKPPQKPVPPPPPPQAEAPELDDDQLFAHEMDGVSRASWRHDPAPSALPPAAVPADDGLRDSRLFQEAVEGTAPPPILEHPEYIEGWVGVAGRRFLPNLRSGVYSIQAQIDLHGLSRVEAREAVEEFIIRMSGERSCCVKIVHGRGINSPNDRAVLKENLQRWLASRRMSHHVVAYASAPYADGGVGAVYVLLRKKK